MKHTSYLLALDGSIESRSAAYLAWDLAKRIGARIVAQHVINVRDIWRFLRPKSAGFIGSGPYMAAFERVTAGLRSIADALMVAYNSQVETQNIQFETHIDEGDPVAEICKRAKEHDLLIIGHSKVLEASGKNGTYSLCEELAAVCPCPMLIVTSACDHWQTMCVHMDSIKIDPDLMKKLSSFGKRLGLSAEFHLNGAISIPEAKDWLSGLPADVDAKSWAIHKNGNQKQVDHKGELPVLMPIANKYDSLEYKELHSFMENLPQPALLLWR